MSRKDLSLSSKIVLLDKIRSQPPNTSHRRLSELMGVPKSTVSRLIHQENQLREEWTLHDGQTGGLKRKRNGKNPDVEVALNQWLSIITARGLNVNGPILKIMSEKLAKRMGHNDFKATDGWLSRWKARHNIKFPKVHNDKETIYNEVWKSTKLPTVLNNVYMDAIVDVIKLKRQKLDEYGDSDEDPLAPVTSQDAKKCISRLQRYFMQEGNEGSPVSALNICSDFVQMQSCKEKRQNELKAHSKK